MMTNNFIGRLSLALALAFGGSTAMVVTAFGAECVKNCDGNGLRIESGQLRKDRNDGNPKAVQTAYHTTSSHNIYPRQQRRVRAHSLSSTDKQGHTRGSAAAKRAHNLVSGKVNKHNKNSVKQRAHNLVSGKVKKTNKKTGTK